MKEHFINELHRLLCSICQQGLRVEAIIREATLAFNRFDAEQASQIIRNDVKIDAEEIHIEEECLKILALYQPVASDLRMVIAMLKINTALERMADFGVHIAERVVKLHALDENLNKDINIDFAPMAEEVLNMLNQTMQTLQTSDTALALRVIDNDDRVDALRHENSDKARELLKLHPDSSGYLVECLNVSRELERIADLNVDICKHILYLQSGKILRHTLPSVTK